MKIGFFDSGLGGLSILQSVIAALPQYDYVYYGDTKNIPYGDKTESEIYALTKEAIRYLFDDGAVLAIIACNTASAETLRKLQDVFLRDEYPDRRILGVIIPTIETIMERQAEHPLLVATRRTIDSYKYNIELDKRGATNIRLHTCATPELVPLIESGDLESALAVLTRLLDLYVLEGGDTVVLGCTHYVLLKDKLREIYGDVLTIISQDEIIPVKLTEYLVRHPEIESRLTKKSGREVHLTDARESYGVFLKNFAFV